jgi:hypothetical protein
VCGHRGGRSAEPVPAPGLETAPSGRPAWIYAPASTSACTRMDGARNPAKHHVGLSAGHRQRRNHRNGPRAARPMVPVATSRSAFMGTRAENRGGAEFGADTPLGCPGQPGELAPIYVFLVIEDSQYPAARRSGRPEASRCTSHAGPHAHSQYRVNRARVIRNDRGPVGCTWNTASGPAGPLPPNVGWMQLKLCHARLCPWRDPGPSP